MKKTFEIGSLIFALVLASCGNPPAAPVVNGLLFNYLTFKWLKSTSGADSIQILDSIPADGVSTIPVTDSIPSLPTGAAITFTTDYGAFLPTQGSSTLSASAQSISVLAAGDTASTLLVSGLIVDTVIVTAGSGSSFVNGRVRFTTSYPDPGGLSFTSNVYYVPAEDTPGPSSTTVPTLSISLSKLYGKVSNHFPISFRIEPIAGTMIGNPSLDIPRLLYVDNQSAMLPFHSNSIDTGTGEVRIIACYQYAVKPDSILTSADTISVRIF